MKKISALFDRIEKFLCVLLGLLFIALIADVTLQVIARYGFGQPPSWTEELARRLMQLIVYGGGAITYRRNDMSGIEIFVEHFPKGMRKVCDIVVHLAIIAFCVFLTYNGVVMCRQVGSQLSPALRMPKAWFYAAIPFFGILTICFAIEKLLGGGKKPEEEDMLS